MDNVKGGWKEEVRCSPPYTNILLQNLHPVNHFSVGFNCSVLVLLIPERESAWYDWRMDYVLVAGYR